MKERKFKIGDYFRKKGENGIYKAMYAEGDYVSGDAMVSTAKAFPQVNVELIDPKTAFLTELKELLAKYDASFEFYDVYDMSIMVGKEEIKLGWLNKENAPSITADNIMNYDKE